MEFRSVPFPFGTEGTGGRKRLAEERAGGQKRVDLMDSSAAEKPTLDRIGKIVSWKYLVLYATSEHADECA